MSQIQDDSITRGTLALIICIKSREALIKTREKLAQVDEDRKSARSSFDSINQQIVSALCDLGHYDRLLKDNPSSEDRTTYLSAVKEIHVRYERLNSKLEYTRQLLEELRTLSETLEDALVVTQENFAIAKQELNKDSDEYDELASSLYG